LLLILLLTIGVSAGLLAGDVAQFVNLGFSNDSRVFVFGQYGVSRDTSVPFASLFFVDVHKNDFIPNGTFQSTETQEVSVGQNGLGTLFNLVHQGTELVAEHGVNHSSQGRLVYLYINVTSLEVGLPFEILIARFITKSTWFNKAVKPQRDLRQPFISLSPQPPTMEGL